MFCSKCVLKHTNAKHEVMPISFKSMLTFSLFYVNECFLVLEMRRMVREMLDEVDQIDRNNSVCEDLYGKLE
jgi:hypothetical protein